MRVSVITTVYNAEQYLRESLDSVFNQTFQDFELILVNDGSTDGSREIILDYFNQHDNVRFLENAENEGIPLSRNRALLVAKGDYIAIHDGDDVSLPERFKKEATFLNNNPDVDFVGSHAFKINYAGTFQGMMSYPPQTTREAFRIIKQHKLNPIIDPSSMFRRIDALKIGGYSMDPFIRTALDLHLWCRLLLKGSKLYNFQEPLIKYRINPEGVTRTHNDKMVEATDTIVATFVRRNFPKVVLRPSLFQQDSFTEIRKN